MSPNIIQEKEYFAEAVDIWALGILLFTILMGKQPFEGSAVLVFARFGFIDLLIDDDFQALFRKIKRGFFIVPSFISKPCRDLIILMLDPSFEKRITAREVRKRCWL